MGLSFSYRMWVSDIGCNVCLPAGTVGTVRNVSDVPLCILESRGGVQYETGGEEIQTGKDEGQLFWPVLEVGQDGFHLGPFEFVGEGTPG